MACGRSTEAWRWAGVEGLDLLGGAGSLVMGMVKGHTQDPSLALELKVCLCAREVVLGVGELAHMTCWRSWKVTSSL